MAGEAQSSLARTGPNVARWGARVSLARPAAGPQHRWGSKSNRPKGNAMRYRITVHLLSSPCSALAVSAVVSALRRLSRGAVVYLQIDDASKASTKGGLFAVKRRPPQPADRRPDRHRTGLLAGRADDRLRPRRRPLLGPPRRLRPAAADQRRRARLGAGRLAGRQAGRLRAPRRGRRRGRPLHGQRQGGGLHALTSGAADDHDAEFSPDGRAIVFVRAPSRRQRRPRTSTRSAPAAPAWRG